MFCLVVSCPSLKSVRYDESVLHWQYDLTSDVARLLLDAILLCNFSWAAKHALSVVVESVANSGT